ncbi:MAG TPA: hypothetical protein VES19_07540 [Candidatus Limnocylindrales bacterium]|nr:hypothetical protein [Candidatus Limnocylindrales bacterium]
MTDDHDPRDMQLGSRIAALAEAGVPVREPADVVRRVTTRTTARRSSGSRRVPALAALALALVVIVGVVLAVGQGGGTASQAATARLGGLTYSVGIARSMRLDGARLTPVGDAEQNGGFATIGSGAYQVDDVDPTKVLLMRLVPGQTDGSGPVGDFLLLVRGEDGFRLTCPYFATGDPIAPTVCP